MQTRTYVYKKKGGIVEHYDDSPLYAIKKILTYYKRADINIEISLNVPTQMKGQIDMEGNVT